MDFSIWLWLAAMVAFGAVEAATAGLVSIWFVAGALAALIAAALDGAIWVQIALFLAVSGLTLVLTRPLVRRLTANKMVHTNADRVLGQAARVTEQIDNERSLGAVYVDGKTWTARSADGSVIPVGEQVEVQSMEGVKLFVKRSEKKVEVE